MAKTKSIPEAIGTQISEKDFPITSKKIVENRYDFSLLGDVKMSNPNGDPDNGAKPRMDLDGYGVWSQQSLEYKIRTRIENYARYKRLKGYDRFISRGDKTISEKLSEFSQFSNLDVRRRAICEKYFDVRMFGGMLQTKTNSDVSDEDTGKSSKVNLGAGILHRAVNIENGKSIDPIRVMDMRLTRCIATNPDRKKELSTGAEMGETSVIPYALYRFNGTIDPVFAAESYFTEDDCALLWKALASCFKHDASFMRPSINVRKLVIWKHNSKLGNASPDYLQRHLTITKKEGVDYPKNFDDYIIDLKSLPDNINVKVIDINEDEIQTAWNDD